MPEAPFRRHLCDLSPTGSTEKLVAYREDLLIEQSSRKATKGLCPPALPGRLDLSQRQGLPGEVAGKSSNTQWAFREALFGCV